MKKIVIIGPESTGKTSLAQALAQHYKSPWIPEYARTYIENLEHPYTYQDLETIAHQQVIELAQHEARFATTKPYLFLDTDLIITKVWFMHVYKHCPDWLQDAIIKSNIDHFLLCSPDLPWQFDPLRENEHLRDFFFDWYQREIELLGKPFSVVKGEGLLRFQCANEAVDLAF